MIKPEQKVCIALVYAIITLLPATTLAKSKPITTTDLLKTLKKGEPWDRGVFSLTKTVNFQQDISGGVDATTVSKITLSYFTSGDCSGSVAGSGSYTTPDGPSYGISVGTPFGLVAASAWNVGSTQLSIADMTTINSIAVTLKSTNDNTPQANFSGLSFACIPVVCTSGECTSNSGTQSFQLKTTASIGDPADGGVIACLVSNGDLYDLVAGSSDSVQPSTGEIVWGGQGIAIGATAQSDTDGAANTTAIVTILGPGTTYAAGLCQDYATTVVTGGYNTWFLPAKDQLNCLQTNAVAIGNFELTDPSFYWSSTEFADDPTLRAWFQDFGQPNSQGSIGKDSTILGVRCVQAFTP